MINLTTDEIANRDHLLEKFRQKTLDKSEADILRSLLEKEKEHAFDIGDFVVALGAIFLIAALIGYIAEIIIKQK